MKNALNAIEFSLVIIVIAGLSFFVLFACIAILPFRVLADMRTKSSDEKLREQAELVMLKCGRFGS